MDIAGDADFLLQRSAAQLLSDLKASLPCFLQRTVGRHEDRQMRLRRMVKDNAIQRMIRLLEPFQEWPQLLDPHLQSIVSPLTGAFLDCIESRRDLSGPQSDSTRSSMSLLRAISKLLYTLCKVRGPTAIARLLRSEPRYLETMLYALKASSRTLAAQPGQNAVVLVWEEKYILLLWMGHLALAPFDLNTIGTSVGASESVVDAGMPLPPESPILATRLMEAATVHLPSAGKDREAAVSLLVRVVLRPDMRRLGLHETTLRWSLDELSADDQPEASGSVHRTISFLEFIAGLVKAADPDVVRPFLLLVFESVKRLNSGETRRSGELRTSALARKAVIKIFRGVSTAAVQSDLSAGHEESSVAEHVLDDAMGYLLESLADSDTLVRLAASKAISTITLRLSPEMTADVSEAILDGLRDNILPGIRCGVAVRLARNGTADYVDAIQERSLAAVNSLRWHGLVLALSQLLYRRAPPVDQLADIIDALLLALVFEQRSPTGASIGATVRDAACFGIWAVARKYTTQELDGVHLSGARGCRMPSSTMQTLANQLMATAVCDTSGNIRRGASAALQELIGRHPDTVVEGIQLVQIVDYHAVALRSRALQQVALETAKLDPQYWEAIVDELLAWRGIDAASVEARRLAASSLGLLAIARGADGVQLLASASLQSHKDPDSQSVERRNGVFLAAAAVIQAWESDDLDAGNGGCRAAVMQIWRLVAGVPSDDITSKIRKADLTIEAFCTLISALLSLRSHKRGSMPKGVDQHCIMLLQHCLAHQKSSNKSCVIGAAKELFNALNEPKQSIVLEDWLLRAAKGQHSIAESHGYLRALGSIYGAWPCSDADKRRILDTFMIVLQGKPTIETKIAALEGLQEIMTSGEVQSVPCSWYCADRSEETLDQLVSDALLTCLGDYTTDQRGDVGSQVRMAAIEVVRTALRSASIPSSDMAASLLSKVCTLAGEKLDKCRFKARACLAELLQRTNSGSASIQTEAELQLATSAPTNEEQLGASLRASDPASISSPEYFEDLLSMAASQGLLLCLLEGLVTSISAGSESIMIASRAALSSHLASGDIAQQARVVNDLHMLLRTNKACERLSVPLLETLAYSLGQVRVEEIQEEMIEWRKLFLLTQKVHYKAGSIAKLTAAIDLYSELARVAAIRHDVLKKLSSMLRHPFPKIRNNAADALFVCTQEKRLCSTDWSAAASDLRRPIASLSCDERGEADK